MTQEPPRIRNKSTQQGSEVPQSQLTRLSAEHILSIYAGAAQRCGPSDDVDDLSSLNGHGAF
jgi:hypothetical protein